LDNENVGKRESKANQGEKHQKGRIVSITAARLACQPRGAASKGGKKKPASFSATKGFSRGGQEYSNLGLGVS